jgi:hypothetical protein
MDKQDMELSSPPPEVSSTKGSDQISPEQKKAIIVIIVAAVILILLTIVGLVYLLNTDYKNVVRIRDVFIIFLAIQSLLIGLVLVILMVQLARLINLLQNEIKPILESTNETVSTLRGTATFLSDNLAQPVIKLNEYLAGFTQMLISLGLIRRTIKTKPKKE